MDLFRALEPCLATCETVAFYDRQDHAQKFPYFSGRRVPLLAETEVLKWQCTQLFMSYEQQEATPQPVEGIVVHDSEVLEPEPIRHGGLVRQDMACIKSRCVRRDPNQCTCSTTHSNNLSDRWNLLHLDRRC